MMPGLLKTSSPGTSAPLGFLILWLGLSISLVHTTTGTAAATAAPDAALAPDSVESAAAAALSSNQMTELPTAPAATEAQREEDRLLAASSPEQSAPEAAPEPTAADPAAPTAIVAPPATPSAASASAALVAQAVPVQPAPASYNPAAPFAFQPPAPIASPSPYAVALPTQPVQVPYNPAAPFAFQPPFQTAPGAYSAGYGVAQVPPTAPIPTVPGFNPAVGQPTYGSSPEVVPIQVPFPPAGSQQTTLPAPSTPSSVPTYAYPPVFAAPAPNYAYPVYPVPYGMQPQPALIGTPYPYYVPGMMPGVVPGMPMQQVPQPIPYPSAPPTGYSYAPGTFPAQAAPAPAVGYPYAPAPSPNPFSPTPGFAAPAPSFAPPASAPTPPTTAQAQPTPPAILPSSALTPPSVRVQGVYLRQGDEDSARARLTAVYPVTPTLLFGGSLDLTTGDAFSDSRSEGFNVNELYLATALEDLPNLRFVIGQLDLTSYFDRNSFAKDGASHFFNSVFQTNPALTAASIGSRPALLVNWSLNDNIEARAAAFSSARNIGDFALDGFAGEVGFRFGNAIIRGTYVSGRDSGSNDGFNEIFGVDRGNGVTGLDDDDREEGYGVNAEVFIPELNMGIFGRYGHYENRDLEEGGDTFSAGISFLDVFSRDDRLGIAYGQALSNERLREAAGNRTPDVLEVFYDFRVLPNLRLGVTFQQQNEFSETVAGFRIRTDFDVTPGGR